VTPELPFDERAGTLQGLDLVVSEECRHGQDLSSRRNHCHGVAIMIVVVIVVTMGHGGLWREDWTGSAILTYHAQKNAPNLLAELRDDGSQLKGDGRAAPELHRA
jgi:hypothetical protein